MRAAIAAASRRTAAPTVRTPACKLPSAMPPPRAGRSAATAAPRPPARPAVYTARPPAATGEDLPPPAPLPSEGRGEPVKRGGTEPGRGPFLKNTKRSSPGGHFAPFGYVKAPRAPGERARWAVAAPYSTDR